MSQALHSTWKFRSELNSKEQQNGNLQNSLKTAEKDQNELEDAVRDLKKKLENAKKMKDWKHPR